MRVKIAFFGFITALCLQPYGHAAGITFFSTTAQENLDPFGDFIAGSCGASVLSCSITGAQVSLSLGSAMSITASAQAGIWPNFGASGEIDWTIGVSGGSVGDPVLLDVQGALSANGGTQTGADLEVGTTTVSVCSDCTGYLPTSWSGVIQVTAISGSDETLQMVAGANNGGSVFADPYVYIDPTWAATNPGYSLDFGNAGNALATPEPGSGGLLLFGLGVVPIIASRLLRLARARR